MAKDRIVIYRTYYDPMLAQIERARLEDAGIRCFISDEHTLAAQPLWNQMAGGIKLNVFEEDIERCNAILSEDADLSIEEPLETGPGLPVDVCPQCGSSNIRFGQATKQKFDLLTTIVSFFLMVHPFYNRETWHCFNCGNEFDEPELKQPSPDDVT